MLYPFFKVRGLEDDTESTWQIQGKGAPGRDIQALRNPRVFTQDIR